MVLLFFLALLDIKFMARGYFLAPYAPVAGAAHAPRGQLALVALPDIRAPFQGYDGFIVILSNGTRKTIELETEDFRLNIVREARDAAGRWRPIEYYPHSWCGNSYFHLYLPPGRHWAFRAPVYHGPIRTRMRFVFEQPGLRLVSNEFPGTINPEQFTRRQGHTPASIMDPYDD